MDAFAVKLRQRLAAMEKRAGRKKRNNDASAVEENSEETEEETMDEMVDRGRRSNHEAKARDLYVCYSVIL